jgi:hypothetical protein
MTLTTCLWFDGNAREAAEFCSSVFPESSVDANWIATAETPSNDAGSEVVVADGEMVLRLDFESPLGTPTPHIWNGCRSSPVSYRFRLNNCADRPIGASGFTSGP